MKTKLSFLCGFIACLSTNAYSQSLYKEYHAAAENIYQHMSLDERIGQLVLPSYALLAESVSPHGIQCKEAVNSTTSSKNTIIKACGLDQIKQYHIGAVLTGGGPYYNAPTLKNWAALNHLADEEHRAGSPKDPLLLTGNDAIHGNMHVQGAVIFPHNINLGITQNPELIKKMAHLVAQDSLASGFNWVYMPTVALAEDFRWGRSYESFSQDPLIIKSLSSAYIEGLQNIEDHHIKGALATAKHFIGDGATHYGLDEGDDAYGGTQKAFWQKQGSGYEAAVETNAGSIMVSYSAIEGDNTRMHFGGKWNIVNQFKHKGINQHVFDGFMVSDWNGATRAAFFYNQLNHTHLSLAEIFAKSINSGVDMLMVAQGDNTQIFNPNSTLNYTQLSEVIEALKEAYRTHLISKDRLKEAVIRILQVKLAMHPQTPMDYATLQAEERTVALQAAEESLVLLKNKNNLLPLKTTSLQTIIFVGETNDLGLQNGGWTVNWQGQKGQQYFEGIDKISSGATTLEEGVKAIFKNQSVHFYNNSIPSDLNKNNTVAIALVAEVPYAEYMGDIANPHQKDPWYEFGVKTKTNNYLGLPQKNTLALNFNPTETKLIQALKQRGIPVVTVVYSGRPMSLNQGGESAPLNNSDALIEAFLPGTLGGEALAKRIFVP